MLRGQTRRYLIILILTLIISWAELAFMHKGFDLGAYVYLSLSLLFSPFIFAGIILVFYRLTAKKISGKIVYEVYLICWLAEVILSFILLFTGNYQSYI